MQKRFIAIYVFCLMVMSAFAQTIPDDLQLEIRNDTLFVTCNADELPRHVIVQAKDRANIYKRILNDATDDLMEDHPADDIYGSIWTPDKVNPYQLPIDSIQDSIRINCSGFVMPAKGHITSKFGPRRYRYHYGTDIKVQIGDTIRSSWEGQVRIVRYDPRGYGNFVVIRHPNGLETVYAHMSRVYVEENEHIAAGEIVGLGGNTGRSTGSHLHYEIRYLGNAINTELLIDYNNFSVKDTVYTIMKNSTFYHQQQLKEMQQAKYITVKQGDNLSILARRYGTSVTALCRLNGIRETSIIRIGQRLRVR